MENRIEWIGGKCLVASLFVSFMFASFLIYFLQKKILFFNVCLFCSLFLFSFDFLIFFCLFYYFLVYLKIRKLPFMQQESGAGRPVTPLDIVQKYFFVQKINTSSKQHKLFQSLTMITTIKAITYMCAILEFAMCFAKLMKLMAEPNAHLPTQHIEVGPQLTYLILFGIIALCVTLILCAWIENQQRQR